MSLWIMILNSKWYIVCLGCLILFSCNSAPQNDTPVVGFIDAFEDATIAEARNGFTAALAKNGYSEKDQTVKIIYRNAQGSIPTLTQIVNYFLSEDVDLLATNTTLSTITAIQKTKTVPVFMMVSPTPELMKVVNADGMAPSNLFGIMENLDYIDTSFSIIPKLINPKGSQLRIGMIYNQSEPQSIDAMERIKKLSAALNITLEAMPVNTSADALLVTNALLNKNIDAFFANPDNTVFASFETILKSCNQHLVPVFTSEAGLVKRGAVAAFGADIYEWGYQAGEQAVKYLHSGKAEHLAPEMVKIRKRVYNEKAAKQFKLSIPSDFEAL
jgi:putative ABC transport system substrate-binding protein